MSLLTTGAMILGAGGCAALLIAQVPVLGYLSTIVGPKFAKAAYALAAVALLGLTIWGAWATWLHKHDKGVIAGYENETNAMIVNEVAAGTNTANAADAAQQAADAERSNAVNVAISNAVAAHPVEAHRAAGPASQAALNSLRNRRTHR